MYFLGSITGPSGGAAGVAVNNQQSGGFAIPPGAKALYLVASQPGVLFEFGNATGSTGATFQTSAARGAIIDSTGIYGPFPCAVNPAGQQTVVSICNTTGGVVSVRVYASPNA
jgi:hypothetical protein